LGKKTQKKERGESAGGTLQSEQGEAKGVPRRKGDEDEDEKRQKKMHWQAKEKRVGGGEKSKRARFK